MKIGVVFPQTEIGADPGEVRSYAQAVEDLGFSHLLAYDHVLGAATDRHTHLDGPYRSEHMFHEILVLFGYLAGITRELELVTGIVIAPQRQTVLLAKQAAEIDVLTGGRFRLGLGIGWNDVEYEALGMSFRDRGRRFEEQIELLRLLWTRPIVDFEGKWHRVTGAGLNPLPIQRPVPIWIGGSSEPALRRAARLADGYLPQRPLHDGWRSSERAWIEQIHGWMREAGRDPSELGIDARINVATGSAEDWRRAADEWRLAGASHLSLGTMGGGLSGADRHVERLREALEAI